MDTGGEMNRAAVSTITHEERMNLQRFGVRNPLGWTSYPITLINQNRTWMSGGIGFTAYERGEMFEWLAQNLRHVVWPVLRTIFPDEDSAIVPVRENYHALVPGHRICVFHNRMNFRKHINKT
jgi:hypothetical protein